MKRYNEEVRRNRKGNGERMKKRRNTLYGAKERKEKLRGSQTNQNYIWKICGKRG